MADVRKLIELCKEKGKVYIQTHNFPDPDAIASAFGLQRLLVEFGVESVICYEGRIDKLSTSKMLDLFHIEVSPYDELKRVLREDDSIICVDAQKFSGNTTDFIGDEIACIDHHPTYQQVEYQYCDIREVGACASLIAEYFQTLGLEPDALTATALIYGIKMDTLQFSRGVKRQDVEMFSFLLPLSDDDALAQMERNNMEFSDLQAYGNAIENIRIYGYVGISHLQFPCADAMIAILSDFILALIEVEVAVIYCERDDGIKFSVRSERSNIHAGTVTHAALEGLGSGGGHPTMAGGLIPKENIPLLGNYPHDFLRERFLAEVEKMEKNA